MKAVFQSKISPAYDDVPEEFYHFPHTYLKQVEAAVGDWIVYYEPRRSTHDERSRGGRQSYFAIAQVIAVRPDPKRDAHYYADVQGYLDFDSPVPFRERDFFYEAAMRGNGGRTNPGAAQRAVRNMSDAEFDRIVRAGFVASLSAPANIDVGDPHGFAEAHADFDRPLIVSTVTRPFRDIAFTRQVQTAYDKKCAMTGLRIINGRGRAEAQAAHIRPVAANGSDSVRNGIALSSTFHWMFDRGLVSIDDDFTILTAKGALPAQVEQMISPSRILTVPSDPRAQPHRLFLHYHRENIFKG